MRSHLLLAALLLAVVLAGCLNLQGQSPMPAPLQEKPAAPTQEAPQPPPSEHPSPFLPNPTQATAQGAGDQPLGFDFGLSPVGMATGGVQACAKDKDCERWNSSCQLFACRAGQCVVSVKAC